LALMPAAAIRIRTQKAARTVTVMRVKREAETSKLVYPTERSSRSRPRPSLRMIMACWLPLPLVSTKVLLSPCLKERQAYFSFTHCGRHPVASERTIPQAVTNIILQSPKSPQGIAAIHSWMMATAMPL
jgi:hypothetical protein